MAFYPEEPQAPPDPVVKAAVEDVIRHEAISIVFQPIVDLTSADVAGYEALTRPDDLHGFPHAGALFDAADQCGLFRELEGIARRKAIRTADQQDVEALLFLNNSPPVFTGESFVEEISREVASAPNVPAHRVVLEITERTAHGLIPGLSRRSRRLREEGFSVALDDVGAGISGLNQIMSLRPNWIKLDIELISGIDLDPLKQNLIRSFVHFARLGNMNVVAEGIERDEELRILVDLGVSHGQGFYLGRPGEYGTALKEGIRARIRELRYQSEGRKLNDPGLVRISAVASPVETCDYGCSAREIRSRLSMRMHDTGIVVLDGHRYHGWVDREALRSLSEGEAAHTEVGALAMRDCPLIGADWTLAEAMEIAASRPLRQYILPLIVQRRGEISGVVTLRDLLMAAAEAHRRAPSHIAPLSGLPSRVQADRWLTGRIRSGDPCQIAFIDLVDFDAFNVAYGFERGDEMLLRLVGLLKTRLVQGDGEGALFLSHLGEDRFLVALKNDDPDSLVALIDEFERVRDEFFTIADRKAGSFHAKDPTGEDRIFPLTSIRVVYLPGVLQEVRDARELYYIAGRLRLRVRRPDESIRTLVTERRGYADIRRESA